MNASIFVHPVSSGSNQFLFLGSSEAVAEGENIVAVQPASTSRVVEGDALLSFDIFREPTSDGPFLTAGGSSSLAAPAPSKPVEVSPTPSITTKQTVVEKKSDLVTVQQPKQTDTPLVVKGGASATSSNPPAGRGTAASISSSSTAYIQEEPLVSRGNIEEADSIPKNLDVFFPMVKRYESVMENISTERNENLQMLNEVLARLKESEGKIIMLSNMNLLREEECDKRMLIQNDEAKMFAELISTYSIGLAMICRSECRAQKEAHDLEMVSIRNRLLRLSQAPKRIDPEVPSLDDMKELVDAATKSLGDPSISFYRGEEFVYLEN